jgi:hypothetical protein
MDEMEIPKPTYIVGIPTGATDLGEDVRKLCGSKELILEKTVDGHIILKTIPESNSTIAVIEDFSTRGTGFSEVVREILGKNPSVRIIPYVFEIINRGGLETIDVPEIGSFKIVPLAEHRIEDWHPDKCPLCMMGSKPIRPKATDKNWKAITTSQLIPSTA